MPNVVVEKTVSLSTIQCSECGVIFGAPEFFVSKRREDHKSFYCPNGHNQYYPAETPQERQIRLLQEQLAQAEQRAERAQAAAASAAANESVQVEARRSLEKKLSRVSAGVCPCCNRTFKQLAAHMKSKHPDFVDKGSKTRLGLAARTGE